MRDKFKASLKDVARLSDRQLCFAYLLSKGTSKHDRVCEEMDKRNISVSESIYFQDKDGSEIKPEVYPVLETLSK